MSTCSSDGEETSDGEEARNGELHDWEMLSTSPKRPTPWDTEKDIYSCLPKLDEGPSCSLGILGDDSEGLIDPNYFAHPSSAPRIDPDYGDPSAVESPPPPPPAHVVEDRALGVRFSSDDSDPSSWIDPSEAHDVPEEDEVDKPRSSGAQELADQEAEPEPRAVDYKSCRRVWWKIPWGVWGFRVGGLGGPWSLAMAAAVMGFVILGRRWYRMRAQNKSVRFQVNADDKRIRLLMFQAVRLNEAFSAVRRVPVVRAQVSFRGYHDGL